MKKIIFMFFVITSLWTTNVMASTYYIDRDQILESEYIESTDTYEFIEQTEDGYLYQLKDKVIIQDELNDYNVTLPELLTYASFDLNSITVYFSTEMYRSNGYYDLTFELNNVDYIYHVLYVNITDEESSESIDDKLNETTVDETDEDVFMDEKDNLKEEIYEIDSSNEINDNQDNEVVDIENSDVNNNVTNIDDNEKNIDISSESTDSKNTDIISNNQTILSNIVKTTKKKSKKVVTTELIEENNVDDLVDVFEDEVYDVEPLNQSIDSKHNNNKTYLSIVLFIIVILELVYFLIKKKKSKNVESL